MLCGSAQHEHPGLLERVIANKREGLRGDCTFPKSEPGGCSLSDGSLLVHKNTHYCAHPAGWIATNLEIPTTWHYRSQGINNYRKKSCISLKRIQKSEERKPSWTTRTDEFFPPFGSTPWHGNLSAPPGVEPMAPPSIGSAESWPLNLHRSSQMTSIGIKLTMIGKRNWTK